MKTVKVVRARWSRGRASALLDRYGDRCIQGFLCQAYGIPDEEILLKGVLLNVAGVAVLPEELRPNTQVRRLVPQWVDVNGRVQVDFTGDLPHLLAAINDMPDKHLRLVLERISILREVLSGRPVPLTEEQEARYKTLAQHQGDARSLREAWLTEELRPAGIELVFS